MKTITRYMAITVCLIGIGYAQAWAGEVPELNSFTAGTPAVAEQVNANFNAVKAAVDDNSDRITNNADSTSLNQSEIEANYDAIITGLPTMVTVSQERSGAISTGYTSLLAIPIEAPSDGNVFITASGMIYLTGKIDGANGSIQVGIDDTADASSPESITRLFLSEIVPAGNYGIPYNVHCAYPVTAGTNTFYLVAVMGSYGSGELFYNRMTAIFIKY